MARARHTVGYCDYDNKSYFCLLFAPFFVLLDKLTALVAGDRVPLYTVCGSLGVLITLLREDTISRIYFGK